MLCFVAVQFKGLILFILNFFFFFNYPYSDKRKPFCTLPLSGPTAGRENCQRKDPPLPLKHRPQTMHPEQPVTGKTPLPVWEGNILPDQVLFSGYIV